MFLTYFNLSLLFLKNLNWNESFILSPYFTRKDQKSVLVFLVPTRKVFSSFIPNKIRLTWPSPQLPPENIYDHIACLDVDAITVKNYYFQKSINCRDFWQRRGKQKDWLVYAYHFRWMDWGSWQVMSEKRVSKDGIEWERPKS